MSALITPDVPRPPDRNLTKELDAIFAADARYAPQTAALNALYSPQYNRTSIQNMNESVRGFRDAQGRYVPGTEVLNREATTAQRNQDIQDVMRLGPAQREAYLRANPELAATLRQLVGRTADSPLLTTLNRQAAAGLTGGGRLTPEEVRELQQQTREGFAERGMLMGNQALGAELLSRDAAVRQRMAGAQQFATGVQGLNQGQNDFVARATGVAAGALSDPFMSILSRSGGAGAMQQPGVYGPQPIMGYGQDLFNTNFNAGMAHGAATAQNQAATRAAIASMAGGAMAMSDARLKENIERVGTSPSGIPIVEWNYRGGDPMRYRGVLAQDVEQIKPSAVMHIGDLKFVDYAQLDVRMEMVAQASSLQPAKEAA